MNGPGDWESELRAAANQLVGGYTSFYLVRMQYYAMGGAAWLRAAAWDEDKIAAVEKVLATYGVVEGTLTSDANYIPSMYRARSGDALPLNPTPTPSGDVIDPIPVDTGAES